MKNVRKQRVESVMKREISSVIMRDIKDPKAHAALVSVHRVDLTDDMRIAHVFVSVMAEKEIKEKTFKALRTASGFVRHEVGEAMRLRYNPEIIFELDETQSEIIKIESLFRKLEDERKKNEPSAE
ncbi:MAG: 30S ribosome-binding factor RbfA [bacterium]